MTTLKPPILSDGYISQFDTFVMPRVLARLGVEGEFGWYAYESWPSGSITFRRDVVKKEKTMDGHVFSVTSTLRHDSSPQVTTFDLTGRLLGTRLSNDGLVREPIDLASLRQIWQSKGLPTER